jgi:hypothetical protein
MLRIVRGKDHRVVAVIVEDAALRLHDVAAAVVGRRGNLDADLPIAEAGCLLDRAGEEFALWVFAIFSVTLSC